MRKSPLQTKSGIKFGAQADHSADPQIDYRAQEAQLVISLKFHHSKTLSKLPLEVVLNAVLKVWDSCQTNSDPCQR